MLRNYDINILIYLIPVVLISLTIHEFSHGFVSYIFGDPTAKQEGRLTLNPFKHLDLFGSFMFLISSFGWAKPVPINPNYYQNKKTGTIIVSLAGPVSNLLLAVLSSIPLYYIQIKYEIDSSSSFGFTSNPVMILYNLFSLLYIINVNLAVFNLIPIPPLDGSKIFAGILPAKYYFYIVENQQITSILFLVVFFMFPSVLNFILTPITEGIHYVIYKTIGSLMISIFTNVNHAYINMRL